MPSDHTSFGEFDSYHSQVKRHMPYNSHYRGEYERYRSANDLRLAEDFAGFAHNNMGRRQMSISELAAMEKVLHISHIFL